MSTQPVSRGILPRAPVSVPDPEGRVESGRHAGRVETISWDRLAPPLARSRLWRRFHHKRWQYVALCTDTLFCGIAIVDVGWTNTAFAFAFDRLERREVGGISRDGLPGLTATVAHSLGGSSTFRWLSNRIDFAPRDGGDGYALRVRCCALEIDAELDARSTTPFLFAVGPVDGGSVHSTQKSPGLRMAGEVRAAGRHFSLDGGVASLDYSNGLLARETEWRWASAHAADCGFNLQSGYFGGQENVVWIGGDLIPLGSARFIHDALNSMAPWRITTDDGLLDLTFEPEGMRRENRNLLVAASRYVQVIGTFSGWVKASAAAQARRIERLAGVTEDHFSRW